jgi:hypothetical protein
MRYHFFLHYGWFFQNLGKEGWLTFMHTTVHLLRSLDLWSNKKLLEQLVKVTHCYVFMVGYFVIHRGTYLSILKILKNKTKRPFSFIGCTKKYDKVDEVPSVFTHLTRKTFSIDKTSLNFYNCCY